MGADGMDLLKTISLSLLAFAFLGLAVAQFIKLCNESIERRRAEKNARTFQLSKKN